MRGAIIAVAGAALLTYAPGSGAQGFGVQSHGGCALAMGAAGVGAPCADGSAVLYNPGALALQRSVIGFGVTALRSSGSFRPDEGPSAERDGTTTWIPSGFLNYDLNPRVSAAVGFFEPYRHETTWADSFPGRYVGYDSGLSAIYLQPTVAFAVTPRLGLGVGLNVIFASMDAKRRLDLAATPLPAQPRPGRNLTFGEVGVPGGTDFADLRISGSGTGFAPHAGVMLRLTDRISVGARYLHSAAIDLSGDARFSPVLTGITLPPGNALSAPGNPFGLAPGSAVTLDPLLVERFLSGQPLDDQGVETNVELPAQMVVGVGFQPTDALRLVADYQWTGWETFEEAPLDFAGTALDTRLRFHFRNTATLRAGAEFRTGETLLVRAGISRADAANGPGEATPLFAYGDRRELSAGVGWELRPGMHLDIGAQLASVGSQRGRIRDRPADAGDARLSVQEVGRYSSGFQLLHASFSYRLGAER